MTRQATADERAMTLKTLTTWMLAWVLVAAAVAVGQSAAQPSGDDSAVAEQTELRMLTGQLADPDRSAKTKLEAATLLLNRTYPQATEALRGFLTDGANRPAQVAVAEAIAAQGGGDTFIGPLMAMLRGDEPAVRLPAARALLTYKNHSVIGRLMAMTLDGETDGEIRLVLIETLGSLLDKEVVDTLVQLMDDPDSVIRDASAEALARLTNIRAFGADPVQWKTWWARNKDKDRSQWMSDLADSLARSKLELEAENQQLRDRLGEALLDYYKALPQADRPGAVIKLLTDPMPAVRLSAVDLAHPTLLENSIADEAQREELARLVLSLLGDEDARVREASSLLAASMGDERAGPALLARLAVEDNPQALRAVLTALGQRRDPGALDAALTAVASDSDALAAAATWALGRIAERHPLDVEQTGLAVVALLQRYRRVETVGNGVELREALLTTMGVVGEADLADTIHRALQDSNAAVRLAAVHALSKVVPTGAAELLTPLVDDTDRGVRRAAILALGAAGGPDQLEAILRRTREDVEPDADVRQQAWEAAMSILAAADTDVLRAALVELADRPDAAGQRIRVMQMLVAATSSPEDGDLPALQHRLGAALVAANRPAEAAAMLGEAYYTLTGADHPQAQEIWSDWIAALLAAGDPSVAKAMDETDSSEAFDAALAGLGERLSLLERDEQYATAVMLASAALANLPHRLTVEDLQLLETLQARLAEKLYEADGRQIARLAVLLTGADEAARKAAAADIQAMGDRAVGPLLDELHQAVEAEPPEAEKEAAILGVLRQVAPTLTQYDPSADRQEKIRIIESWRGES